MTMVPTTITTMKLNIVLAGCRFVSGSTKDRFCFVLFLQDYCESVDTVRPFSAFLSVVQFVPTHSITHVPVYRVCRGTVPAIYRNSIARCSTEDWRTCRGIISPASRPARRTMSLAVATRPRSG